jgi:hypothetical protein
MTEDINPGEIHCPRCGQIAAPTGAGAYVEVGEWDGKQYEGECNVDAYRCTALGCDTAFYMEY